MTDKFIDFSKGELVVEDYIISITATPRASTQEVALQNRNYSVLKDVKVSFNNNEVVHNREPLYTDYSKSIATQYGFDKDTINGTNAERYVAQKGLVRGAFYAANNRYLVTLTIPLKHISQFFRMFDFPIMNQLVEVELNINNVESIVRGIAPVEPSEFRMTDVVLFVPEVVLPTAETSKYVKKTSSGDFV